MAERTGVVLADAGYWHQERMERIVNRGIDVLIPPDAGKRVGARPGWDGGFMPSCAARPLSPVAFSACGASAV